MISLANKSSKSVSPIQRPLLPGARWSVERAFKHGLLIAGLLLAGMLLALLLTQAFVVLVSHEQPLVLAAVFAISALVWLALAVDADHTSAILRRISVFSLLGLATGGGLAGNLTLFIWLPLIHMVAVLSELIFAAEDELHLPLVLLILGLLGGLLPLSAGLFLS